jgi:hypothetical protein
VFTKASLLEGPGRRVVDSLKRDRSAARPRGACAGSDVEEGIGVSNFSVEQLQRIQQIAPVETLQPQYSLVDR